MTIAAVERANRQLDDLVDRTRDDRDRTVDFVRAGAIAVVVLWHWVLSVLTWDDGELVMPNPIAEVPLGWAPTWLLQVMPLFFFVGGFANLAAWQAVRRDGGGSADFYAKRLRRLLPPVAAFAGAWATVELVAWLVVPGYRGVLAYGAVTFIPLWFLAAYGWVVAWVPVTARAHERRPFVTMLALAAAVIACDAGRFALGQDAFGWVNTALVWIAVHQLGYFYRDGRLTRGTAARRWGLALGGFLALIAVTTLDPYPRSMVAVEGAEVSHMYPTTVGVLALAVFQAGLVLLARAALNRWLGGRRLWKAVVAVNVVVMTVFLWHMTALLAAVGVLEGLGVGLVEEPTAVWWARRPVFLLLPGVFLAVLVRLFARFETAPIATR